MQASPIRVLLVEDEPADAEVVARALSTAASAAFDLCRVGRLAHAAENLSAGQFDVLLLGLGSPDLGGLEAIQAACRLNRELPIVVLGGVRDEATALAALDHGAQDYLEKGSLTADSLRRSIRFAIQRQQLRAATIERERKRVEQELCDTHECLELAIRGTTDGLADWSLLTKEAHWSPRLKEMLGFTGDAADELENSFDAILARMHPDDRDLAVDEISQGVLQQTAVRSEFRLLTRASGYRWFQGRGRAAYDVNGRPYHFGGALTDITDRKQLEAELAQRDAQLRQAHKLEAVGSLAGGIAHEFNNLLQAIRGNATFAMEGLSNDEPRYQDLEQVIKAADRAAALTRELLGFSRLQVLEQVNFDCNELVNDLVKMIRPLIGEQIDLQLSLATGLGTLRADRGLMQQMLLNLCINARDAMPTGGRLTLKTQHVDLSDKYCELHPSVKPGAYVVFSVADTGCGIPPEVKERIFEPFFTTKGVGKGTGLGLAMVYGCVQQHGGLINVYSEPHLGTTFKIYLPISAEAVSVAGKVAPVVTAGGKETILLAEDEPMVRDLAVRILTRAGYSVLVASDGAEAVSLFERNAEIISLALFDAIMPKMTGHQAYERIQRTNPRLPVVFCTGYDPETGQVRHLMEQGIRTIQKPYDPEVLLRAVRETLDAHLLPEMSPCAV